ncbi:uncharacterized protein LOC108678437 [Hyalella azteca]|uniref:Uncharacterized protein LOC108678437 n=1 Tax=Hyalella azteca TaxID=294128 RepID=A0A8B7PAX0_HYAAZ|nr:uncharacterized protein LOC108678437 [Hyalella azteca]
MAAGSATFQDRTLNKVAVCSAVFAGFAYVGYSYARTAFCRKLSRRHGAYDDDSQEVSRMVFRRLSQTSQTDALSSPWEGKSGGRPFVRPKSVQARIRELNLRARQFSDAFVAIQSSGGGLDNGVSRTHAMHTHHSLQCSPWSSPRLLSPVDVRGLTGSVSTENLTGLPHHASPTRPKWRRQSLRRKRHSFQQPLDGEEEECMEVEVQEENEQQRRTRMEKETREMYSNSKEQLIERLRTLMDRGRLLSPFEAKTLVALLCAEDTALLERTLVTIANCATFTLNVDLLRDAGCIVRLCSLLTSNDERIKLAAVQTLGNVLLAPESILQAQTCLPPLLDNVNTRDPDDPLLLASLVVLTNVATLSTWHGAISPVISRLYALVDCGALQVQLQALRLLVNLSCNKDMILQLLAAEGPQQLLQLVSVATDRAVLLRVLTLLATLAAHAAECSISAADLPGSAAAESSMFTRLLGDDVRGTLTATATDISRYHPDPEVRRQANRLRISLACPRP